MSNTPLPITLTVWWRADGLVPYCFATLAQAKHHRDLLTDQFGDRIIKTEIEPDK
jgi:hypothetical protein